MTGHMKEKKNKKPSGFLNRNPLFKKSSGIQTKNVHYSTDIIHKIT